MNLLVDGQQLMKNAIDFVMMEHVTQLIQIVYLQALQEILQESMIQVEVLLNLLWVQWYMKTVV